MRRGSRCSASSTEVWTSTDTFAEFASSRQNRPKPVGYSSWIAIGSLDPRAARRGLRRKGVLRVSHVRAALLWIRPRALHTVPAEVRRRLLVQTAGRVPVLQRQAYGADYGASRRPRHPAGARAAVGDFTAQAAAGSARRPAQGRRGDDQDFSR